MLRAVIVLIVAALRLTIRDAHMLPAVIMLIVATFGQPVRDAFMPPAVVVLALTAIIVIVWNAGVFLAVVVLIFAAVVIVAFALASLAIKVRAARAFTVVTDTCVTVTVGMRSFRAPTVRMFATLFAPIVALAFVTRRP